MTKTEQDKILENKIRSNTVNFIVNRQSAIVSALVDGEFDKYEYLTRIDLALNPNSLEKERFENSPLGNLLSKKLDNNKDNDSIDDVARIPFDRTPSDDQDVQVDDNMHDQGVQTDDMHDQGVQIDDMCDQGVQTDDMRDQGVQLMICVIKVCKLMICVIKLYKLMICLIKVDKLMIMRDQGVQTDDMRDQDVSDNSASVTGRPRHRPPRTGLEDPPPPYPRRRNISTFDAGRYFPPPPTPTQPLPPAPPPSQATPIPPPAPRVKKRMLVLNYH